MSEHGNTYLHNGRMRGLWSAAVFFTTEATRLVEHFGAETRSTIHTGTRYRTMRREGTPRSRSF